MDLSVQEAATLLGISARTVRARLLRGDLPGIKRGRDWKVDRSRLPLTDAQRERLQARAAEIRQSVEEALPPTHPRTPGDRHYSVADLQPFRVGMAVRERLTDPTLPLPDSIRTTALHELAEALVELAECHHQYSLERKMEPLQRARGRIARVAARLLLCPKDAGIRKLCATLEGELLPMLGGLSRSVEDRRGDSRRRDR